MNDRGFIYDFLPGLNPEVVDVTWTQAQPKSIRIDLAFSPDDLEPNVIK